MATLAEIATAAADPEFQGRVAAAAALIGIPPSPNLALHVAATVDVSKPVTDEAIMAAVTPDDVQPEVS